MTRTVLTVNGKVVETGAVLSFWRDGFDKETQRPTQDLCYGIVLKTHGAKITVRDWDGKQFAAVADTFFNRIDEPDEVAQVMADHFHDYTPAT